MAIITIPIAENFSFQTTIRSHGWFDLLPFVLDEEKGTLEYVFRGKNEAKPVSGTISEADGGLQVEMGYGVFDHEEVTRVVRHMLRLDDDISSFYLSLEKLRSLTWVINQKAEGFFVRQQYSKTSLKRSARQTALGR